MTSKVLRFSTAALLAATLATPALAKDDEVNITGATLFTGYFHTLAQGSDFIDGDADGVTTNLPSTFDSLLINVFQAQARGIGSGNGLQELVNFGYANGPAPAGWGSGDYDSTDYSTRNSAIVTPSGSFTGDVIFDIAALDVPASWFVTNTASNGSWHASPFTGSAPTNGYGNSGRVSNANTISTGALAAGGQGNNLKSLTPTAGNGTQTLDLAQGNDWSLYDTQVAWVPIAVITNYGAQLDSNDTTSGGDGEVRKSSLQHLFVTGRLESGENLVGVTRDSGSGTRNGAMNSLGIDPSWGVGDNVGQKGPDDGLYDQLGNNFVPTNKTGSSRMEDTVTNHRLAVGYTGLADGTSTSRAGDDSAGGRYMLAAVGNDTSAGWLDSYVYPLQQNTAADASANNVVYNSDVNTGWQIGGSETFVTEGNPRAGDLYYNTTTGDVAIVPTGSASPGVGFTLVDAGDPGTESDPMMDSPYAALYMRNLIRSLASATLTPTTDPQGTPGDFLASSFSLIAGVEARPDDTNTDNFITNPDKNDALFTVYANDPSQLPVELQALSYGPSASNGNRYGRYSNRNAGEVFTDRIGSAANDDYMANNGANLVDGGDMVVGNLYADRNQMAGDFDGDHDRDADDIDDMVTAYLNSAPVAHAGYVDSVGNNLASRSNLAGSDPYASLEFLGDFNGDGNFDVQDVRYAADGLFTRGRAGGNLDRRQNFIDVDTAAGFNLFHTTLATGKTYAFGDSRGDVAGSITGPAAGWAPVGYDGTVDAQDIDYVYDMFKGLDTDASGGVEWANLDEAVFSDLSADMTGDLAIDQDDIDELVQVILGTEYGDATLDGVVDVLDVDVLAGTFGTTGGWADGDFNGDGIIDVLDVDIIAGTFGFGSSPFGAQTFRQAAIETGLAALVPEPASVSLLVFAAAGLIGRRRR